MKQQMNQYLAESAPKHLKDLDTSKKTYTLNL